MADVEATSRRSTFLSVLFPAWRWWIGTLANMVPLSAAPPMPKQLLCIRPTTDGVLEILNLRHRKVRQMARLGNMGDALTTSLKSLDRQRRRYNRSPVSGLVISSEEVLHRSLELPLSAERDLRDVLLHQIDRLTPYASDQACWTYGIRSQDHLARRMTVEICLVPRKRISGRLDTVHSFGFRPTTLAVLGSENRLEHLIPLSETRQTSRLRAALTINWLLVVLNVSLLIVLFGLPLSKLMSQKQALMAEIDAVKPQAEEVFRLRSQLERAEAEAGFLATRLRTIPETLSVLGELTRLLPDSVWLERMKIADRKLEIVGYGNKAASLIATLEASPMLREVQFRAPVTMVAKGGQERFHIGAVMMSEPQQ